MTHHNSNPYLEELNHQEAQQAHYERGVRITGDTNPTYAHELYDTITTLGAKAKHWEYENTLNQHNIHPILLPEHVTDAVFPPMEDMSEYEGWVVKLTVTYTPATQTLHCDLCSVLEGEESPAVPYSFPIPSGQELEYRVFTEPHVFTYQPEPETSNLDANMVIFLPELSYTETKGKKILRPHGLYLLAPKP